MILALGVVSGFRERFSFFRFKTTLREVPGSIPGQPHVFFLTQYIIYITTPVRGMCVANANAAQRFVNEMCFHFFYRLHLSWTYHVGLGWFCFGCGVDGN